MRSRHHERSVAEDLKGPVTSEPLEAASNLENKNLLYTAAGLSSRLRSIQSPGATARPRR